MMKFSGKLLSLKRIIIVYFAKKKHPYNDERIRNIKRIMRRHQNKISRIDSSFQKLKSSPDDFRKAMSLTDKLLNYIKSLNKEMSKFKNIVEGKKQNGQRK